MDSNFKNKKSIVVITGVSIDKTPVIKSLINYYSDCEIIKLEYIHKRRLLFIFNAILLLIKNRNSVVFFIGIQTLPIISIVQFSLNQYFYWELETYFYGDNNSFVIKLLLIKKLINWKKVNLIIPDKLRTNTNENRKIKNLLIIPNTPGVGNNFYKRYLSSDSTINLIIYGNLNNNVVYAKEWIKFVQNDQRFYLLLIGRDFDNNLNKELRTNVEFKTQVSHTDLLILLKKFHFSVIGYRPVDFNHKFCSPNKLFESFALSLPVITNMNNPTLVNILDETNAGLQIDFDKPIDSQLDLKLIFNNYEKLSMYAFNAYKNKYNFEYFAKEMLDSLINLK